MILCSLDGVVYAFLSMVVFKRVVVSTCRVELALIKRTDQFADPIFLFAKSNIRSRDVESL